MLYARNITVKRGWEIIRHAESAPVWLVLEDSVAESKDMMLKATRRHKDSSFLYI